MFINYHLTIGDLVNAYDEGQPVNMLEMGGIGPGYEQAIQVGIIECCRLHFKYGIDYRRARPGREFEGNTYLNGLLHEAIEYNEQWLGGLSGAQAGAIMNVMSHFLAKGYGACIEEWRNDKELEERMILVDKMDLRDVA